MGHTGKRLRLCLAVVVLAAVFAGLLYWFGGGNVGRSDGTVLVSDVYRTGREWIWRT